MQRSRLFLASLLLGAFFAADAESRPEPSSPLVVEPGPTKPELGGRWMLVQVTTAVSDIPFVGEARASTRAVLLYDLVDDGKRLRGNGTLCSLDIDAKPDLLRPYLPKSFAAAVRPAAIDAALERDATGTRFLGARSLLVVGAQLDRPEADPLPESPSDPRLEDVDHDGNPGITFEIRGLFDGEVYMAQRRWDRLEGRVVSPERVDGTVYHGLEQTFLGSDLPIVNMIPDMAPDPARSPFRMVRVPAEMGCPEAMRLAETSGALAVPN